MLYPAVDAPRRSDESAPESRKGRGTVQITQERPHIPPAPDGVTEVVIVGAGPAGLAVAGCLRQTRVPFILLDRSDRIGAAWHRHYDRLHLHTHKRWSALPYLPFPRDYPAYPSRQQFIDYLNAYTRKFQLEPRFGEHVTMARFAADRWHITTDHSSYRSRHLVIATGQAGEPNLPHWPGQETFRGRLLHSSAYTNGTEFRGKRVLVVGFGNSGGEIALDLSEHGAQAALAVRGPVNILPRDVLGIPGLAITSLLAKLPARIADLLAAPAVRATVGRVQTLGLRPAEIGPFEQIKALGRIPLIDVGTLRRIRSGAIAVRPGIERFTEQGVAFVDGRQEPYDAVILATGYRPVLPALASASSEGAVDLAALRQPEGRGMIASRLYFCGFRISAAGMLNVIGQEARAISRQIHTSTYSRA